LKSFQIFQYLNVGALFRDHGKIIVSMMVLNLHILVMMLANILPLCILIQPFGIIVQNIPYAKANLTNLGEATPTMVPW
jgi:hypothetical protein